MLVMVLRCPWVCFSWRYVSFHHQGGWCTRGRRSMLVHGECGAVESHHDGPVVRCYSNISRDAVFAVKPVFPHLRKYGPSDCQSPLAAIWYLCHRFVLIAWNRDFELVPFLERLWRCPSLDTPQFLSTCICAICQAWRCLDWLLHGVCCGCEIVVAGHCPPGCTLLG